MTRHTPEPLTVTTTDHQPPGYPAALICFRRGSGWEVIAPNVSSRAVADEIAGAYNATYAAGINPEAVKDLRSVLTSALKWWGVGRPAPTWVVDAQAALAKAKLP